MFGVVENLHNEGDWSDVSHIGGVGGARTASEDAADAAEGVSDARPGVSFGREYARLLGGRDDRPLPRVLVLAGKIVAGVRRNVICSPYSRTCLGTILEDDQARVAIGVKHGQLDEVALGDLVSELHATVSREFERGGAGGVQIDLFHEFLARVLVT